MNALYLVLTIEVFAGDEEKFFIDRKLFTSHKDAMDYFDKKNQRFCHEHCSLDDDGEVEYDFEEERHDDEFHEYWWNGTSHHFSEIIEITPQ